MKLWNRLFNLLPRCCIRPQVNLKFGHFTSESVLAGKARCNYLHSRQYNLKEGTTVRYSPTQSFFVWAGMRRRLYRRIFAYISCAVTYSFHSMIKLLRQNLWILLERLNLISYVWKFESKIMILEKFSLQRNFNYIISYFIFILLALARKEKNI